MTNAGRLTVLGSLSLVGLGVLVVRLFGTDGRVNRRMRTVGATANEAIGGESSRRRAVIHDTHARDFLVRDEARVAPVRLTALVGALAKDATFDPDTLNANEPALAAHLRTHGRGATWGDDGPRRLTLYGAALEPGDRVAVMSRRLSLGEQQESLTGRR